MNVKRIAVTRVVQMSIGSMDIYDIHGPPIYRSFWQISTISVRYRWIVCACRGLSTISCRYPHIQLRSIMSVNNFYIKDNENKCSAFTTQIVLSFFTISITTSIIVVPELIHFGESHLEIIILLIDRRPIKASYQRNHH
jgi:hypothetical protein